MHHICLEQSQRKRIIFDDESIFHSRSVERVNIKGYDYEIGYYLKMKLIKMIYH